MKTKNEPHNNTPEKENEAEIIRNAAEQEHAWWESVKYSDTSGESER